ncbi:jg25297 [Pararge aegeria aegeria]|uniref:Jg25297 protein n=1 Tax=Pararge aegeria aegeria TaxID=348720 RepID=A0A8S4S1H8_9NEOP|nr:jg25297 [Pararge aegeria aegeria]
MFKLFVFACFLALATAKPLVSLAYTSPVAYTAPVAAAYTAPVAYSAYTAPVAAYSAYTAPLAAYSAYSYASPYSAYYFR